MAKRIFEGSGGALKFTSRLGAIATSVVMLHATGTDAHAQTPAQAATPPKEWAFDDVVRAAVSQHPIS
jgi:hypothetical protein